MSARAPDAPLIQLLVDLESPTGAKWLVGVVKRTYSWRDGVVRLAREMDPLVLVPQLREVDGQAELSDDTDAVIAKPCTDVIVTGTVVLPEAAAHHDVAVAAGHSLRRLRLCGPRRARVTRRGKVSFSSPEPFSQLTLGLRVAYGGVDRYAHAAFDGGRAYIENAPSLGRPLSIFAYPRNPVGRGYFVDLDRRRADRAELPQAEDPDDLLVPERFFVPRPRSWIDAPVPGHLGWVPPHCYPRVDRLVGPLVPREPSLRPIHEASLADGADLPVRKGFSLAGFQGAAPGLAVERLRGDEVVILQGLVPEAPRLDLRLPGERPRLALRVPDLPPATPAPTLQTLRIDLQRRTLSLTWVAAMRLLTLLPDDERARCALTVEWPP